MRLAWHLAIRDLRQGGRGLLLLALCLFLGTAALAGIGSLSASMIAALDAQARTMLGGDLELRVSQRRATVEEAAIFAEHGRVAEAIGMRAMAEPDGGAAPALVDLKGVDANWPLVGNLKLKPGALLSSPHGQQAAIAQALADRLALRVGDKIRVGIARLTIIGIIDTEPDLLGEGFRLGPRVLVDMAGLEATGLVQPGSLYESRYRVALPAGTNAQALGSSLKRRFPGAGWSTRTVQDAGAGLRRAISQLGQFLLLVGLAASAIAGIGVGSGVAAYLAGKTPMIAMLKVMGASARTIAMFFLVQLGLVAGSGIAAGMIVGAAVPAIVTAFAGASLPILPQAALYPVPLLIAAVLSAAIALLFALPALARAGGVPAAALLREIVGARRWPTPWVAVGMVSLTAMLVALAVLTATDRQLALGFVAATAVLISLLWIIGLALRAAIKRAPHPRRPVFRLALANLHRPGAQTERLVVALGLGFALFVALAAIDTSLSSEMKNAAPAKAPRFFAIDLQPEDSPRFRDAVARAAPGATVEASPSLRGAIVALNGRSVADMKNLPQEAWILRGDRTITWAARLPARNEITAGRWWSADYRGSPLVSIEGRAAAALGLKIGDEITVSVLGVDVRARIAALRKVDWGGLGLNFAIIFSPGLIEEAPHSLLASVYAAPSNDGVIARTVGATLPSVTLVRVGDVIGQIGAVLSQVALAVRAAAAVTVAAGMVVLSGAIASSARARRTDSVILKLLGASRSQILCVQAVEFLLLSLLLATIALIAGVSAGWYVVTQVFKLGWAPSWTIVGATLATAIIMTFIVGIIGTLSLLQARPAAALRAA